jgi:hypothetical protein
MSSRTVSRRWYRFAYHAPREKDRESQPHQLRDGDAALFLAPVLQAKGYSFGGPLFNYAHPQQDPAPPLVDLDHGFLQPEDLILLTTHPPMNDVDDQVRRPPMRSFTTLEDKIFAALRRHFSHCSRSHVIVSEEHARQFPRVALHRNKEFKVYRQPQRVEATAAYMAYEDHAWPGGPALLAAFSMGGTETLVWTYWLGKRFPHLVAAAPFVMAEMVKRPLPKEPLSMSFADEWDIELLTGGGPISFPGAHESSRKVSF